MNEIILTGLETQIKKNWQGHSNFFKYPDFSDFYDNTRFEPLHIKTYKMICIWQDRSACASTQSEQCQLLFCGCRRLIRQCSDLQADLHHSLGAHVDMSLVTRKPVFGVCDQVRLKPTCSVTETSSSLEFLNIEMRDIVLSSEQQRC